MKKSIICLILGIFLLLQTKAQVENPFGNPLIPDMIADVSIQEIDGLFYCYATTDGYDQGLETSGPPVVWMSKDFVHWSFSGSYFPAAVKEKYWAPSKAVAANDRYYIYPTINGYMYAAVANKPVGPFKLARGKDEFYKSFTSATLLQTKDPSGIDAEIFVDDDHQAYVFWGKRHVAKLGRDMISVDTAQIISTPRKGYSEGPIFFKRKGIYYYLYTIGGDEKYQYAYVMSKVSPLGPFEHPKEDIISTTNYERRIFGPGHGCVFNLEGTDDWYFAFLEFGRRSTNRQTYVNRLKFNEDGTICPVDLTMEGVGALRKVKQEKKIWLDTIYASSVSEPLTIEPMKDTRFKRTEYFLPLFAADGANGSRWMAANGDSAKWIVADLGVSKKIQRSEVSFVRPTAGHAYLLEASTDGSVWESYGGSEDVKVQSPHIDLINKKYRYLRIKILKGVAGIWEWSIY
ncbi:family 43 glycosylhydrolase [Olivibacter domesticus]|uniref:F5/8 type C domain-containing protein n=1 Tax=Olivibacter domesticus TaxID=407022 RepID=A0A1H7MET6_OLID1|nr:family 43 glycosylhydrolase [Olivibacter domesticus]SEL09816.1 F5/8 type C domain-containing protein [Olivibacter domesticus]